MGIADDYIRLTLRIPETLHKALLKNTRQSKRSMNSEIIFLLEQSTSASKSSTSKGSENSYAIRIENLSSDEKDAFERLVSNLNNAVLESSG